MINYNIGDLVTRINTMYSKSNSYPSGKANISNISQNKLIQVPYTKDNYQIVCLLTKLGILKDFNTNSTFLNINFNLPSLTPYGSSNLQNNLSLASLTHVESYPKLGDLNLASLELDNLTSVGKYMTPHNKKLLTLVSKPGKRIYVGYKDLNNFNNGFKLYVLRTSKGIITSQTAFKYKIGGELLFKISFTS
jgi:ribosomal protein S8